MPVRHIRDVGSSDELRQLVSQVDIHPTTIPLVLDRPRTLRVVRKETRDDELIVECRSAETNDRTRVILYLPFRSGSRANAKVITYPTDSEGS